MEVFLRFINERSLGPTSGDGLAAEREMLGHVYTRDGKWGV